MSPPKAPPQPGAPAGDRLQGALRSAALAASRCAGMSLQEVAAMVAARAIRALCSKPQPEGQARP
jgi:hypothetical protein